MQRHTKEFKEMQSQFEKTLKMLPGRVTLDFSKPNEKESSSSDFYNNGDVNSRFHAFMSGYAYAKSMYQ